MSLKKDLETFLGDDKERRIAFLGIGSDIRGDEAAGLMIIDHLKRKDLDENILLLNTGLRPENFTGKVRDFKPTHVIMVDAAHFDGEPGEGRLIPTQEIGDEVYAHNTPLTLLKAYLEKTMCSNVALLGVQYQESDFSVTPTPEIGRATQIIAETIYRILISKKE
jgi:hydrogenase 3 maturation protease